MPKQTANSYDISKKKKKFKNLLFSTIQIRNWMSCLKAMQTRKNGQDLLLLFCNVALAYTFKAGSWKIQMC